MFGEERFRLGIHGFGKEDERIIETDFNKGLMILKRQESCLSVRSIGQRVNEEEVHKTHAVPNIPE